MALGLLGSYVSSSSEDEDEAPKILVEPKPKPALLLSNPFGSGSTVARAKPSYALEIHVRFIWVVLKFQLSNHYFIIRGLEPWISMIMLISNHISTNCGSP